MIPIAAAVLLFTTELEARRLLEWNIGRLGALEDSIDLLHSALEGFVEGRSVRDEATGLDQRAELAHGRNAMLPRELIEILPVLERHGVAEDQQAVRALARSVARHGLEVGSASNLEP